MNKENRTASIPGYYMEFVANVVRQLPRDMDETTAQGWNNNQRVLKEALAELFTNKDHSQGIIASLELDPHNFRIDSTGWKKIIVDGEEYWVNPEGDVWEFAGSQYKGEQLFTHNAATRETKKAGKRMPTDEEFTQILRTKADMPNLVLAGHRYTNGSFNGRGAHANFWSSTEK